MKTGMKRAAALLAGFALGVATASAVHAQEAKPPAFTIAEIEVLDPDGFQEFAKRNAAGVAAAGGRFLALRGRTASTEGTPPKGVALIAWESLDQAVDYFNSPTFRALVPLRDRSARVRVFHVEGLSK